MYNNVQAICAGLARSGCLILCYIHVAEKITGESIDALRAVLHLAQMGYVKLEKGKEQAEYRELEVIIHTPVYTT